MEVNQQFVQCPLLPGRTITPGACQQFWSDSEPANALSLNFLLFFVQKVQFFGQVGTGACSIARSLAAPLLCYWQLNNRALMHHKSTKKRIIEESSALLLCISHLVLPLICVTKMKHVFIQRSPRKYIFFSDILGRCVNFSCCCLSSLLPSSQPELSEY